MITAFSMTRQDIELLIGAHKAFAARCLEGTSQLLKESKPLEAVDKMYNDAGEHLRSVDRWSQTLAEMDKPSPDATEGALEHDVQR